MAGDIKNLMKNSVEQHPLVVGTSCWVRAGTSASDAQKVGFVDTFNATKQLDTQEARVIGSVIPASIDVTGIRCNLSLGGFLATADVHNGNLQIAGNGAVSLASFNPRNEDFISGEVVTKFPYMDFYDEKLGIILASFEWIVPNNYQVQGNGGAYVKANVSAQAIYMSSGDDYLNQ